jgi:hypothetical protein
MIIKATLAALGLVVGVVPPAADTDHFTIDAPKTASVPKDMPQMAEAVYALCKARLGGKEPAGKLKIRVYSDADDYHKDAPKGSSSFVKDGELLLPLNFKLTAKSLSGNVRTFELVLDRGFFNGIASGVSQLYFESAYPSLGARKDIPAWFRTGLADYFAACGWKDGKLETDSPVLSEINQSVLSFQYLVKSTDWLPFERGLKAEGKAYEVSKRAIHLQGWAIVYWLFNAPADRGGKGKNAATVPEFLAELEGGAKFDDAFKGLLKKLHPAGALSMVEKSIKDYFSAMKAEIADREEGNWLVGETAHYIVHVQKGAENKKFKMNDQMILKDMKFKMELLFEKYSLAFGFQGRLSQKAVMKLYKNKNAYMASGAPPTSAAYYSPMTKELVGYEDSAETGIVFQIFCHEGCHQFFDLAFPGFYESEDLPMWFSEGLADCFGSSYIAGKNLYVFTLSGVAEWRIQTVKEAVNMRQAPKLSEITEMGRAPFMANGGLHYAQSWSFCHFLWNAPELMGGKGKYREVLIRLIHGFKAGKPKDEVYKEAFQLGGKPLLMDVIEEEWKDYVRKLKVVAGPK